MNEFKVAFTNGAITTYKGTFSFLDDGILSVQSDGKTLYYSPAAWLCVDVVS